MYSKPQLEGIILAKSIPELTIYKNPKKQVGYEVRIRVVFRGNEDFLLGIQRSLNQQQIHSKYKEIESKTRNAPVLRITGIENLMLLTDLTPKLPDSKNKWHNFRDVIDIMWTGLHTTQEGLDRLLKLKGVI